MSEHAIKVQRSGHANGMDFDEEYEVTFRAERGDAFGWPELHFVSISPDAGDHGAFSDLAQADLESWAADWLDGDGYDAACRIATQVSTVEEERRRDGQGAAP